MIICHYTSLACFILGTGQRDLNNNNNNNISKKKEKRINEVREKVEESEAEKVCVESSLTEFSWDEQGFSLMTSLYSDIAHYLDDKLR